MKVSMPYENYHQLCLIGNKMKTRFCHQWDSKEIRTRKRIHNTECLPCAAFYQKLPIFSLFLSYVGNFQLPSNGEELNHKHIIP